MRTSFPSKIRADFPILKESNRGKPLAYLDNAASSQKPKCVIDSISAFTSRQTQTPIEAYINWRKKPNTNIRRHETIANWFSANPQEFIFARGTTEALNLVANSYGQTALSSGDCIILTEMEHHANIVPRQLTAEKTGAQILTVPVLADGSLDQEILSSHLKTPASKILSLAIFPIHLERRILDQIIREAKKMESR